MGKVKPVGGVRAKIEAALQAGATRVLIPKENWQAEYGELKEIQVIPVETLQEVLELAALKPGAAAGLEETEAPLEAAMPEAVAAAGPGAGPSGPVSAEAPAEQRRSRWHLRFLLRLRSVFEQGEARAWRLE